MSVYLRIVLVLVSICSFVYISVKLKKSQLQLMDAFFWIVFSLILILMGLFPGIPSYLARIIGFQAPVNFVYLVIIFLLILRTFLLTLRVSVLENKLTNLTQEIAIRDNEKSKQ